MSLYSYGILIHHIGFSLNKQDIGARIHGLPPSLLPSAYQGNEWQRIRSAIASTLVPSKLVMVCHTKTVKYTLYAIIRVSVVEVLSTMIVFLACLPIRYNILCTRISSLSLSPSLSVCLSVHRSVGCWLVCCPLAQLSSQYCYFL